MQKTEAPPLDVFFNPTSIAVVGASRHANKVGNIVLQNIVSGGYEGKIFPVNPYANTIHERKAYATIEELPEQVDLGIIALPADKVLGSVKALAKKGTKYFIVFSAGFKEIGDDGAARELALQKYAEKNKLHILGPNCLGFIATGAKLNATFGRASLRPGNVRFISQSGAVATSLFDWADELGIGFDEFVTLGNKSVIHENDILQHWLAVEQKPYLEQGASDRYPVGMYLESIEDGKEFVALAREMSQQQPLLVIKPGKSQAAQLAMQSHTGALAGEARIFSAACKKAGAIECEGLEDMFDLLQCFAWEQAPTGPRVAVVSNAGGPAVIITDAIEKYGLKLAGLDDQTVEVMHKSLPRAASLHNPVDVLGDAMADRYAIAVQQVLRDKTVDAVVVLLTPQVMTEIKATAEVLGTLSGQYNKPIVCSFVGGKQVERGRRLLQEFRIPSFLYPERAVWALAQMYRWHNWRSQATDDRLLSFNEITKSTHTEISKLIHTEHAETKATTLSPVTVDQILKLVGIPTPKIAKLASLEEATQFVHDVSFPVVLKISSGKLVHKIDQGGVITDIDSGKELQQAFTRMSQQVENIPHADIMIQQQIGEGVEVLVGVKRDPHFGLVALFGLGGTLAELVNDSVVIPEPFYDQDIMHLISETKAYTLLQGFRSRGPYALDKVVELIFAMLTLLHNVNDLAEIEINPVIVTESKAWAVDGKARMC